MVSFPHCTSYQTTGSAIRQKRGKQIRINGLEEEKKKKKKKRKAIISNSILRKWKNRLFMSWFMEVGGWVGRWVRLVTMGLVGGLPRVG